LKEVEIVEAKKVNIGTTFTPQLEDNLVEVLKRNSNAFEWSLRDMSRVDPDFVCHKLDLNPWTKLVIQRRRKFGEEKIKAIVEETNKLISVDHT